MDRELVNQVPEMSGLARRLRDEDLPMSREEVAKEVEQLERELALEKHKYIEIEKVWMSAAQSCSEELAAEKALADRLADILEWNRKDGRMEAISAYRKARGL